MTCNLGVQAHIVVNPCCVRTYVDKMILLYLLKKPVITLDRLKLLCYNVDISSRELITRDNKKMIKTLNNNQIALDKSTNLVYNTNMINDNDNKGNEMNVTKITSKSQANLELFLTDRRIEKKFSELGQGDNVDQKLGQLWAKRKLLINFINS
jgi:hypothetical protein